MMEYPYEKETSPLISSANQWTGFYVIETTVTKELKNVTRFEYQIPWLKFILVKQMR